MKPMTLHPLSAIAGAGIIGLSLFAASAAQEAQSAGAFRPDLPGHLSLKIEGVPTPQQMMRVVEVGSPLTPGAVLSPYIVPSEKIFVVTGGCLKGIPSLSYDAVVVKFDGVNVFEGTIGNAFGDNSMGPLQPPSNATGVPDGATLHMPPGFVAPAGTSVSVRSSIGANAVLLGYLVDA